MSEYSFSIIIPTRNRPERLVECLKNLSNQIYTPKEIIIIDDGDLPEETKERIFEIVSTDTILTESDGVPGTSTAINTGVRRASGDIVVTIADDMLIGDQYLARLAEMYESHDSERLAGVGKAGSPSHSWLVKLVIKAYRTVFYLNLEPWTINRAGMQYGGEIEEPISGDYITGGGASYKRDVLLEHPFACWDGGREVHEDIEVCWRLTEHGYHFIIDPELPSSHLAGERHDEGYREGIKKGRNRVRIFARNGKWWATPFFVWAMIGKIASNFFVPFFLERQIKRMWPIGFGMIIGFLQMIPLLVGISGEKSTSY